MSKILHLLCGEPDDTTAEMISTMSNHEPISVVRLYPDEITGAAVDWDRLVDDIMAYDKVITW